MLKINCVMERRFSVFLLYKKKYNFNNDTYFMLFIVFNMFHFEIVLIDQKRF